MLLQRSDEMRGGGVSTEDEYDMVAVERLVFTSLFGISSIQSYYILVSRFFFFFFVVFVCVLFSFAVFVVSGRGFPPASIVVIVTFKIR